MRRSSLARTHRGFKLNQTPFHNLTMRHALNGNASEGAGRGGGNSKTTMFSSSVAPCDDISDRAGTYGTNITCLNPNPTLVRPKLWKNRHAFHTILKLSAAKYCEAWDRGGHSLKSLAHAKVTCLLLSPTYLRIPYITYRATQKNALTAALLLGLPMVGITIPFSKRKLAAFLAL